MKKFELLFIYKAFFLWLFMLFAILFIAVTTIPVREGFLGGGTANYIKNPYFWSWANFDGEHYTSIAKLGYGYGQNSFFPLYPLLIRTLGSISVGFEATYYLTGIFISWGSFAFGLVGFYKLLRQDFSMNFSRKSIIFLLLFPTAFYFAAVYTESLFFALLVWGLYFARKQHWFMASVLGVFLTATRFVGIVFFVALIAEWIAVNYKKGKSIKGFPTVLLIVPIGLISYMFYLQVEVGDMFAFFNNLALFGEQRSSHLVTLPQVFYRYFFRILPSLNTNFLPVIYSTYLEFLVGLTFVLLIIYSFRKLRLSYWLILSIGYLIPTMSGSFSSLPRYVLVLFPTFIMFSHLFRSSKNRIFLFYIFSFILLVISFALFGRGYWVS